VLFESIHTVQVNYVLLSKQWQVCCDILAKSLSGTTYLEDRPEHHPFWLSG